MEDFMEVGELGRLKIDKIIFESFYPILFTCVNEKQQLFLCVCCQANEEGKKWLITRTTPQIMIDILTDRLTLREAFCKIKDIQYTVLHNSNKIKIINGDKNDWDYEKSYILPDKDEYLEAEEGEFDEEIAYYQEILESTNLNLSCTIEKVISEYISSFVVKSYCNYIDTITCDFNESYAITSKMESLNQNELSRCLIRENDINEKNSIAA